MDPSYNYKTIADLSDEEFESLAFLGGNVAPGVRIIIDTVRANPMRLGSVTCFAIDCLNRKYAASAAPQEAPVYPTVSDVDTFFSQLSREPNAFTVVAPALISKFESKFWYHGISGDPPNLLWRSDLKSNPFPHPPPGARFFKIPTKTAHGVFNTRLNEVWDDVAPKIIASMKKHQSQLLRAQDGSLFDPRGRPRGRKGILSILADAMVQDVVVEWYEGSVQMLVGPPLMQ